MRSKTSDKKKSTALNARKDMKHNSRYNTTTVFWVSSRINAIFDSLTIFLGIQLIHFKFGLKTSKLKKINTQNVSPFHWIAAICQLINI